MLTSLVRGEIFSPLDGWSWYGAHQLLEIVGVPFEVTDGSNLAESEIVIIPNASQPDRLMDITKSALREGKVVVVGCDIALALLQNNISIGATPIMPIPFAPTEPSELLPLKAYAILPATFTEVTLPLLGEPLLFSPSNRSLGLVQSADSRQGSLVFIQPVENGTLVVLGGRVFETCGLLLSRFSWFAHPHRRDSLMHKVDPLWDEQLKPWHRFPIVSFYAQFFAWLLSVIFWQRGQILPLRWCLPHQDETPFKMALTALHDVEIVYDDPTKKQSGNQNYCFAQWLDLEQRLGLKSAFFFLSPVTALPPFWRLNYDINDEPILAALDLIEERGGEVGLLSIAHASENALAMEREKLEDIGRVFIWGVRSYRFGNTPASVRHKSSVGFAYDSSWFAGQSEPSFLTGCVHPFRPLDTERWQVLPIIELGTVLDERVLFGELVGSQRNGDATHLGIKFCETVFALNGMACLSWQQHTFNQRAKVFEQITRHCFDLTKNDIWLPKPREIAEWWTMRNEIKVSVKPVGKRWWKVEVSPPEELSEALAFVLAIPILGKVRVVEEGKILTEHNLGPLGQMKLCGVPLILEPGETCSLSVGMLA